MKSHTCLHDRWKALIQWSQWLVLAFMSDHVGGRQWTGTYLGASEEHMSIKATRFQGCLSSNTFIDNPMLPKSNIGCLMYLDGGWDF